MMKNRYMRQALSALAVLAMGASVAWAAEWTPGPPLNVARHGHGAVVGPCGHIWVLGGIEHYSPGHGTVLDSVEKLEWNGQAYAEEWTVTSIVVPTARFHHATATANGFIYVIGGLEQLGGHTPVASVWRYDILGDAWTQLPDLNTQRSHCRATVDRFGRIWVVAGLCETSPDVYLDTVEIFDPARLDLGWVFGPPLNEPRRNAGVVADRWGRLYAIGGTNDHVHIATVERLDPCGSDWLVPSDLILPDLSETDNAVVGADGRIYVAGGWMPWYSDRALRFTPYADPERWNSWGALGQARNCLSLVLGYDDKIYAIGGESGYYQSQNTVEWRPTPMGMVGDINDDGIGDACENQSPVILCNEAAVLWSPDHGLIDVNSAFSVDDPDEDPLTLTFRVFSDESEIPETGDGTGRHAPDFKDEHDGGRGLLVRAERRGREDGRYYIFVVTADDGNGGVTTEVCVAAVVPHDQDQQSLDDVIAQAEGAASIVQDAIDSGGHLPPAGLHEHGLADPLGPRQ